MIQTLEELCRVTLKGGEIQRPKVKYLPSEHATYKINGKKVVGASTVAGRDPDGKQMLIGWANKMGLNGIYTNAFLIHSANIGTMAHKMVELDLQGGRHGYHAEESDMRDIYGIHPQFDIYFDYAENAYDKYVDWLIDYPQFKHIATELPLINYSLRYGGTIDIYGELNGKRVLIDLKTSSSVYMSHKLQVSAYEALLKANYYPVDEVYILQISRDEGTPYHFEKVENTDKLFDVFKTLLDGYYKHKEV